MRGLIGLLLVALLFAPAAFALDVGVDFDEAYNFLGKKSYAWQAGKPAANALNQKRIVAGVDKALAGAGFTKVDSGEPDLFVATETSGEKQIKSSKINVGLGLAKHTKWGSLSLGTSSGNRVREVLVGTLVIAILDGKTQELVWRANATDTVSNDPKKTAAAIERAIGRAFKDFPPQPQ